MRAIKITTDHVELEMVEGDYVYYALKDDNGTEQESSFVVWSDLADPNMTIADLDTISHVLDRAYQAHQLTNAGELVSEEKVTELINKCAGNVEYCLNVDWSILFAQEGRG